MRRTLRHLSVPLREPFATAGGVVSARDLLLLTIEDDEGIAGFGEAAALEPYDGVSTEAVAAALTQRSGDGGPPQPRAAEEMARLDLEARRDGRPLGELGADTIAVNRTLPAGPPDEVAARAEAGVRAGYSCFKLKVGLPDDLERVAAVREAIGPWPALRIDANGAWGVEEAIAAIQSLEKYDLQLVEQPCRRMEELAAVCAAVEVPVAADEVIAGPDDVRAAAATGACDVVNVKLASSGGFTAARATLRAATENGLEAFISSTLDGPWGIAAALQLAASEGVSLACGLATLELFEGSLARALPAPEDGLMAVPQGPGLGVTIEDEAIAEVLVEELG